MMKNVLFISTSDASFAAYGGNAFNTCIPKFLNNFGQAPCRMYTKNRVKDKHGKLL
jgi:hypothetical protein